jgi:hypothetical protein
MDIAMEAVVNATLDISVSIVVNEFVLVTLHGLIFQLKTIQLMPHIQNARIWGSAIAHQVCANAGMDSPVPPVKD